MTPSTPRCTAFRALSWPAKGNAAGICAAVAAFATLLWPQWCGDDNLAHGVFLPVLAGLLFAESRRDPAPHFLRAGLPGLWGCLVLILASLASLAAAIVYAAALGWTHSMAEFLLAVALVFALGAAWLAFADERVGFVPLNWAAGVAVCLWLFASPMPPGTYSRLALFLQAGVTDGVVRVLNAFGIAAFQDGNVIELARASVGVSEACSGIRSLVSCTVAGLFLSALLVRRPVHRAMVMAISPAIGLAMNFVRSLLLTLLVNSGIPIEGRWHDVTGASILVVTTILVAAFAFWLHRREPAPSASGARSRPTGRSPLQGAIACALLVAAAGAVVLSMGGAPSSGTNLGAAPDLAALLPPPPAGWTARSTADLDQYSEILQTHTLVERVYAAGPAPGSAQLTLYLAYWRPGQAPVSLVDAHTPDACWPGTGWVLDSSRSSRCALEIGGRTLAPAESRQFSRLGLETRVWFWHLYGGRPIAFVDPYSVPRLLGIALRYGLRPPRDQLFVRVSSNRPWQEIATQPALRQFLANLEPLGL